jgi:hypothetical protein
MAPYRPCSLRARLSLTSRAALLPKRFIARIP